MTTPKELSGSPVVEDAELERLMDELEKAVVDCVADKSIRSNLDWIHDKRWNAAREALRSYVSADTRRLDLLDNTCRAIELRPPHFDGSRAVFRWQVDMEGARSLRPSVRAAIDLAMQGADDV